MPFPMLLFHWPVPSHVLYYEPVIIYKCPPAFRETVQQILKYEEDVVGTPQPCTMNGLG